MQGRGSSIVPHVFEHSPLSAGGGGEGGDGGGKGGKGGGGDGGAWPQSLQSVPSQSDGKEFGRLGRIWGWVGAAGFGLLSQNAYMKATASVCVRGVP